MSILQQQKEALQRDYIEELKQNNPNAQSYSADNLKNGSEFLVNAALKVEGIEAECGILTKVDSSSALGKYSYEPTLFIGTYRIDRYQRLELFFIGYVLEQIQSKQPDIGRIIGMDGKSHKVRLENSSRTLFPFLEPLKEWTQTQSPEPPPLILSKYCDYCQFQSMCREQAEQEDNLSLLDAISTPKAVGRYEKKGIFTVKQLSYLFRPKKRKRRTSKSPPVHKPELQALAIRTGKIYIQELPDLSRRPVELFLDIEGIPDQGFYYLIGLLVCSENMSTYHSFWADALQDEAQIWRQFLEKVAQYPKIPIYHYGSYEPRAIKKLARRYETDVEGINDRLVNVNNQVYGKVYFPTRSNRLKEIGSFIGASWTSAQASGLQSLVWRHYWEETHEIEHQKLLITYNEDDCIALKLLTNNLSQIKHTANIVSEVDFADQPKRHATETGKQIHSKFDSILKFAQSNYDKKKISFGQGERKRDAKKRHQLCCRYYPPPELSKYGPNQSYEHGFKAWVIYLRVALRIPYGSIVEMLEEQLREELHETSLIRFVREFAEYYLETEEFTILRLLESPFIHVDETPVNMRQGAKQYVWVFTDGENVVFRLRKTREAIVVHDFLADYNGILISDFYPGYDAVECKQQKCWSHLIRDLNNDLWKNPFDVEFETFILEVKNLIVPIIETVQEYGLKKRYLSKFKKQVNKFYQNVIIGKNYRSELVLRYQKRFIRHRGSLFTFLEQDGIPWHNNPAENALRHLNIQEKISGVFYESVMSDYLLLLGIRQTCRFRGNSFFKFLFSGGKDIDKFR